MAPLRRRRCRRSSAEYKKEVAADIDGMYDFAQQMVDLVFSFGELGFQEFETQQYLTGILEKEGFTIERGIAGIPTAWMARWGSGKPVIALGSDVDCIPQASQKPGVAYREPIDRRRAGPWRGPQLGHAAQHHGGDRGQANHGAREASGHARPLARRRRGTAGHQGVLRARGRVQGRGRRALQPRRHATWARRGATAAATAWCRSNTHSRARRRTAPAPRGAARSALDAVELMNVGWNYRREHLRLQQRSHYVITNGGDQPNVVPRNASVWYYFRETTYEGIKSMWEIGDKMAQGRGDDDRHDGHSRVLGSAWPLAHEQAAGRDDARQHQGGGSAEVDRGGCDAGQGDAARTEGAGVGPRDRDSASCAAARRCRTTRSAAADRTTSATSRGTCRPCRSSFPANFQAGPGTTGPTRLRWRRRSRTRASNAGAKVQAMTVLDIADAAGDRDAGVGLLHERADEEPQVHAAAPPEDKPAIWLNEEIMAKYRPEMKKYYYEPTRYKTYLEQLGAQYPTVRADASDRAVEGDKSEIPPTVWCAADGESPPPNRPGGNDGVRQ